MTTLAEKKEQEVKGKIMLFEKKLRDKSIDFLTKDNDIQKKLEYYGRGEWREFIPGPNGPIDVTTKDTINRMQGAQGCQGVSGIDYKSPEEFVNTFLNMDLPF